MSAELVRYTLKLLFLEKSKWLLSSSYAVYPEQDGIIINGESYVDGGISAPAPPTALDTEN